MRACFIVFSALLLFASCSRQAQEKVVDAPLTFRVEKAPEWTALFNRSEGWFGGDGIFAIPFAGVDSETANDSLLFLFSDTMVGHIKDSVLQPGYKMINNSVMVLRGNAPENSSASFLVNNTAAGEPATLFTPKTPDAQKDDYYWLGDGFMNHATKNTCIFAYRIRNTHNKEEAFPFREVGNSIIVIPAGSRYPFVDHRQIELPAAYQQPGASVSFGVGVLDNTAEAKTPSPDGYVYAYGVRGRAKELVAARTKPEAIEDFEGWEFWNGTAWSSNFSDAKAIEDSVSNELSVTPIGNNQYALVYQYGGILPTIYMQVGPTPAGPFGPRQKVWDTTPDIEDPSLFSYNAKAHPAISGPGELLVSYNVNSFKFNEVIEKIPNLYRPRFVRIVFDRK